jgi:quercetin dioxygenase-like cupin family protein
MSMRREARKYFVCLAIAGTAMAALATVVFATAGSGAVGTIMARAAFTDPVDIKIKLRGEHEVIHVPHAQDTVMQQIVIAPGGHTGWHSHPGPAIALVKSGELTLYSSEDETCTGQPFGVGQGFVDSGQGHVHMARNLTAQPAEVWVTYLDVPPGGSVRIDVPDPGNCNF